MLIGLSDHFLFQSEQITLTLAHIVALLYLLELSDLANASTQWIQECLAQILYIASYIMLGKLNFCKYSCYICQEQTQMPKNKKFALVIDFLLFYQFSKNIFSTFSLLYYYEKSQFSVFLKFFVTCLTQQFQCLRN